VLVASRCPYLQIKPVARRLLIRLQANEIEVAAGIRQLTTVTSAEEKTLADHLIDYESYLRSMKRSDAYIKQSLQQVRDVLNGCGFVLVDDFDGSDDRVMHYLAQVRRGKKGNNVETSNHYVRAVRAFARWLEKKVKRLLLRDITILNPETDRRRPRRCLSEKEMWQLVDVVEQSTKFVCGLTGRQRALLYRVAIYTGCRASELASLTPRRLSLETAPPTLTLLAGHVKNRREATLPLHPDLVADLRASTHSLGSDDRLWPGAWAKNHCGSEMIKADLAAASIPYRDGLHVFDFHATRGQYITRLARARVHPKVAQTLARHSRIELTMNVYTKVGAVAQVQAVNCLPGRSSGLHTVSTNLVPRVSSCVRTGRPAFFGNASNPSSEIP
jgi:integrase